MLKRGLIYLISFFAIVSIFSSVHALKIYKKESPFFDERQTMQKKKVFKPEYIIIHFTANCSYRSSWQAFFNYLRPVSAHYLIDADGKVVSMVHDSKRAWHAGDSSWKNNADLGAYSIGIELINPGFSDPGKNPCQINKQLWNQSTGKQVSGSPNIWYDFTEQQITSLIKLCRQIIKKYNILDQNVLGHSDISPGRKVDPGPLFPWKKLAQEGVGLWYDDLEPSSDWSIADVQRMLQQFGYKISITQELDPQTIKVVQAFQMHFQQNNISGTPDDETMQILKSLTKKVL